MTSLSTSQETFDSLEERWLDVLDHSLNNNVFYTPTWQRMWWEEFGADSQLHLFGFSRNSVLEGVAPLMISDGQLTFVGSNDVCDYMDVVVREGSEDEVYPRFVDLLMELDWRTLFFSGITERSATYERLPDLLKQQGLTVEVRAEEVCPKINLPGTWDEYLASLRKKDRHELRRKMRRLENAGDASYHTVHNSDAFHDDLEEFLSLLINSRADKAQFMTAERQGFFYSALSNMAEKGYVKLIFLELDGIRVSSAVCFDYNNSFFLYNSGYNPDYSSLSVGLILKAYCLKEAIEEGKDQFDFLRGAEPYKYHLGAQDEPIYRISATR